MRGTSAAGPDRTLFLDLTTSSGASLGQGTGTILNDRVALDSVSPKTGGMGQVTLTLHGSGFTASPGARLRRDGQPDIVATDVSPPTTAAPSRRPSTPPPRQPARGTSSRSYRASTRRRPCPTGSRWRRRGAVGPPGCGTGEGARRLSLVRAPHLTNAGNVDATNALVRIDGFQIPSRGRVLGRGIRVHLESGLGHSVVIAVDRVPPGSTTDVRVNFTPVGTIHSLYRLHPFVIEELARTPASRSRPFRRRGRCSPAPTSDEQGVVHVAGAGASGDISYEFTLTDVQKPASPSVKRTESGDRVTYAFTARSRRAGDGRRRQDEPLRLPLEQPPTYGRRSRAPEPGHSTGASIGTKPAPSRP